MWDRALKVPQAVHVRRKDTNSHVFSFTAIAIGAGVLSYSISQASLRTTPARRGTLTIIHLPTLYRAVFFLFALPGR